MTASTPNSRPGGDRNTVPLKGFLIPSVFGDEPPLADLRREVRAAISLEGLVLPDTHARGRLLSDMAATGRNLTEQIEQRQPTGPIIVVGFSFGASLALEVAGQLERAGRQVGFLGILDGPFEPPEMPKPREAARRFPTIRRLVKPWAVSLIERMPVLRRLMMFGAARRSEKVDRIEPMRRAILWHLRSKALKSWTPPACDAPGLHISTGDYGFANRARWAELCPNLRHAEVRAVHQDLLKKDALKAVSALLIEAVADRR